jgi:hypothetical protein
VTFAREHAWQHRMASDMSCAVIDEMGQSDNPLLTQKLMDVGVSVPQIYAEVVDGAHVTQPFCVTIGRKELTVKLVDRLLG